MNRNSWNIVVVMIVSACGGTDSVGNEGTVVGGPCTTSGGASGSCDDGSMCVVDTDFPDGTCVKSCASQDDCPDGTACIQEDGGICVLTCDTADDCRDAYNCVEKSTVPTGGTKVCILQ